MDETLTPWLIRYGYLQGAFPMADDSGHIDWYTVRSRCLFPISGVHVSHSLARRIKKGGFEIRFDTDFEQVMRCCMRPDGNWINEEIIRAYTEVHREGWGHCGEVWEEDTLIGGIYGIAIGGCFSAESMFHRKTDGSKIALWAMVERCRELGFTLFDAEIMNPHLNSMGAYEVPHREFMEMFKEAQSVSTAWSLPIR